MRFDFRQLAGPGERLRLAANLPYNISTPLLFHLLDQGPLFTDLHVMLQKEVVRADDGAAGHQRLRPPDGGAGGPLPRAEPVRGAPGRLHAAAAGGLRGGAAGAGREPGATADGPGGVRAGRYPRLFHAPTQLANALKGVLTAADISACGLEPAMRPGEVTPQEYIALARRLAGVAD